MKYLTAVIAKARRLLGLAAFESSQKYWIDRYKGGGDSGHGSYGLLAQYKAEFLNTFVEEHRIETIIEHGCGDGNQLSLAKYPHYSGYDISPDAVARCKERFKNDPGKTFFTSDAYNGQKAQLALSLDVIYHLVEEPVFEQYMRLLFTSSEKYTIIYSTNERDQSVHGPHIKHRRFTDWVQANLPGWELVEHVPNPLAAGSGQKGTSKADFFIYRKVESDSEQVKRQP